MDDLYKLDSYDYHLPESQIAQHPSVTRGGSRLLTVDCGTGGIGDCRFADLAELVRPHDLLVVNDTKVFPARLLGHKETGGRAELLLLHYPQPALAPAPEQSGGAVPAIAYRMGDGPNRGVISRDRLPEQLPKCSSVEGLVKSSKRPKPGMRLIFGPDLEAEIDELLEGGAVRATLRWAGSLEECLGKYGCMPLPPYIHRSEGGEAEDRRRYQTVYARENGAIAAPTAGLHFTDDLLLQLAARQCAVARVTLHVGYATFAPVRVEDIRDHQIHAEYVRVSAATVAAVAKARSQGGRIWAVGTTSARALEFAATAEGGLAPVSGFCKLYIWPGYQYRVVDNLITNFHLPKSSLLFMVSAFAGQGLVMEAYRQALRQGYRFYSYGDAMALIRK